MFRIWMGVLMVCVVAGLGIPAEDAQAQHRIGGGLHYLRNLGDIKEDTDGGELDFSQDSFSIMASYQYNPGLLKLEGDVEYVFDYVGTGNGMWTPQAWVLVGGLLYGGGGIGIGNTDGDWQQNPWYALRVGVDLALSKVDLDIFASYQFQSSRELEDLTGEDLDSLTFAALLRFDVGGK